MSATLPTPAALWGRWQGRSWTTVHLAAATMVTTHVVVATFWVLQTVIGVPYLDARRPLLAAALLGALVALQARHSAAAAKGVRPAGWQWSLAAIIVLVVVPQPWFDGAWSTSTWVGVASSLMLLPHRAGIATAAAVAVAVWLQGLTFVTVDLSDAQVIVSLAYSLVIGLGGGTALWASVEAYRVIRQLDRTTASIGELAIAREQLRQAADVHDLLGQNLTAIGLRADVGRRLAERDSDATRREAVEIVVLAMQALGDLRGAAHGNRPINLADELDAAAALLRSAGVDPSIRVLGLALDTDVETALAWCVREAVTNVVRHAHPTYCEITVAKSPETIVLRVVNDGAGDDSKAGNGLRGMAHRAESVGGQTRWTLADGVFNVKIDLPDQNP